MVLSGEEPKAHDGMFWGAEADCRNGLSFSIVLLVTGVSIIHMKNRLLTYLFIFVGLGLCQSLYVSAQVTGRPPGPGGSGPFDSNYVFLPAKPLLVDSQVVANTKSAFGMDLAFSQYGYGMGLFYNRVVNENVQFFTNLTISAAKSPNEFEFVDWATGAMFVPGKINRIFLFPLTLGVNYRLFPKKMSDNFRPHISVGYGPTIIMTTPYLQEFFGSFGDATLYSRFGGFVGIGAQIGALGRSTMAANVRYFSIPTAGTQFFSIQNVPITEFGGLFLTISIGFSPM